jgi:hypothetical protein
MICEATVPVTGRRCGGTASITIIRLSSGRNLGGPFHLCAICALREQRQQGDAHGRAVHDEAER